MAEIRARPEGGHARGRRAFFRRGLTLSPHGWSRPTGLNYVCTVHWEHPGHWTPTFAVVRDSPADAPRQRGTSPPVSGVGPYKESIAPRIGFLSLASRPAEIPARPGSRLLCDCTYKVPALESRV